MDTEIIYDFSYDKIMETSERVIRESQARLTYETEGIIKRVKRQRRVKALGRRYTITCRKVVERKGWLIFVDEVKVTPHEYDIGSPVMARSVSDKDGNRFMLFILQGGGVRFHKNEMNRDVRVVFCSYHMMKRYAQRKMQREDASIMEVVEDIAWSLPDCGGLFSLGTVYGNNKRNLCISMDMPEGLGNGYKDFERGVLFIDTYIHKSMFDEGQQKIYNSFPRDGAEESLMFMKETEDGYREMTAEELYEQELERSTEEWRESLDKELDEMIAENRRRWKRKAMRGADGVKARFGNKK